MTRWIPEFSVSRPVTVVTAFLVILVVGIMATFRIPLQMMPSGWDFPYLWVWAPYQDATPVETEGKLLKPLEEQLATVPGLKNMSGNAEDDGVSLSLEFHTSVEMDDAYNSVTDRVDRARVEMPDDLDRTYVFRFNPSDEPVIWGGISSPIEEKNLFDKATRIIQRRLQRVPGVGRVDLWGVDEPIVWVDFNRDALQTHGIDLQTLMGRLATDNFQLASGQVVDQGSVRLVRALARFEDLEDLRRYIVAPGVVLGDVANVVYRPAASTDINRIDGKEGAALGVNKESSANTVEVCRLLNEAFLELSQDPRLEGYTFPVFFDQGKLIEESLGAVLESAVEGGILAVIVLLLFLREWRITLLIAATIPASLLLTLIVLYFRGDSLNLLSMLGLMLAVGMVVDNAVVVVETIYRRRQAGEEPRSAAISGTAEVLLPITLSTLTSVVVFLPIILMSGDTTTAFFLGALGLPVVFIQIGSLVITLFFTPLSTVWLSGTNVVEDAAWLKWLSKKVDRGLEKVLAHPLDSFMGLLAALLLTIAIPGQSVSCSGDVEGGVSDFNITFTVPQAFTYYERKEVVEAIEDVVKAHQEEWGVRVYVARIQAEDRRGRVNVYLEDDGPMPKEEVIVEARKVLPQLAGVEVRIGWQDEGRGQDNKIEMEFWGEDTELLGELTKEAQRRVRLIPGILGAETGVETEGKEEMRLTVDREATARYGVASESVGRVVSFAMRGLALAPWYQGEREVRVQSRFRAEDQARLEGLLGFGITSRTGETVPLRALVRPDVQKGWGRISRENRQTATSLTVDLGPDLKAEQAYERVEAALRDMEWPRGYGMDRGDAWKEGLEDQKNQYLALILSVVFVFLIMGVLFESFLLPLTVITTVPMAMMGVWWGLWATDTAFDGMAVVGLIILVGIVVNNGIVLIDMITELRATGMERQLALREAVRLRLRPILMTALTAIVGVIPMATGSDSFVGIPYAPLGRVVGSGMMLATVLTLFFVPFLYAVLDDVSAGGSRWFAYVWPRRR